MDDIHQEMLHKLERNRDIMNKAVLRWLRDDDRIIEERIDYEELELVLSNILLFNGIDVPFTFSIHNNSDSIIYTSDSIQYASKIPAQGSPFL